MCSSTRFATNSIFVERRGTTASSADDWRPILLRPQKEADRQKLTRLVATACEAYLSLSGRPGRYGRPFG